MAECWPPCSAWCTCVDGGCRPSPEHVNAVLLRTPDGRYLMAANGGGRYQRLVAVRIDAPWTWETLLLNPPTRWPLHSGDDIAMEVVDADWNRSGFVVRVQHTTVTLPRDRKSPGLVTYQIGGPGAAVCVSDPFPPARVYPGDEPIERTFVITRMDAGGPAPAGTPVRTGDVVSLLVHSGFSGRDWYFRVTGDEHGAEVHADAPTAEGATRFHVAFGEVRSGLGWRPTHVTCRSCAAVTAVVTGSGGAPIGGARAVALVAGHPFEGVTGPDGRVVLRDAEGRDCVPTGSVAVQAGADRHRTATVVAAVPAEGAVEVPVQLGCTPVTGRLVDDAGTPVPGAPVVLRDPGPPAVVLRDADGAAFMTATAADGTFGFSCVPHTAVQVWTPADPAQLQHTTVVPPDGWSVTIVVPTSCGDLVGRVVDATTGAPIAGATVTESGGRQATADPTGCFVFTCLRPAGDNQLLACAPGYGTATATVTVPASGTSDCSDPPSDLPQLRLQRLPVAALQFRLDWSAHPTDLDAHLSGPAPAGGRFHLFYAFIDAPPVDFVRLDADDTTALGPELAWVFRTPRDGPFLAGDYRFWVHNHSREFDPHAAWAGSGATVSVLAVDTAGGLALIARYGVVDATGPEQDHWHVVDLRIEADGRVSPRPVQQFRAGDQLTEL